MAEFEWDEPKVPENLLILIAGGEGVGKTHAAMTFPEPILFVDTEHRAALVIRKFKKRVFYKRARNWDDVRKAVGAGLRAGAKTVIIDSASDLREWTERHWAAQAQARGRDKVFLATRWGEINAMLDKMLDVARRSGVHWVFTARIKREYVDGKMVGWEPDIYYKLPYKVDLAIWHNGQDWIITKDAYNNRRLGGIIPAVDYGTIQKLLDPNFKVEHGELQPAGPVSSEVRRGSAPKGKQALD